MVNDQSKEIPVVSKKLTRRVFLKCAVRATSALLLASAGGDTHLHPGIDTDPPPEIPAWEKPDLDLLHGEPETTEALGIYDVNPVTGNIYLPPEEEQKPYFSPHDVGNVSYAKVTTTHSRLAMTEITDRPIKFNRQFEKRKFFTVSDKKGLPGVEITPDVEVISRLTGWLSRYKYEGNENGPRFVNAVRVKGSGILVARITDMRTDNRLFLFDPKKDEVFEIPNPEVSHGRQPMNTWIFPDGIFMVFDRKSYFDPASTPQDDQPAVYFFPPIPQPAVDTEKRLIGHSAAMDDLSIDRISPFRGNQRFVIHSGVDVAEERSPLLTNPDTTAIGFIPQRESGISFGGVVIEEHRIRKGGHYWLKVTPPQVVTVSEGVTKTITIPIEELGHDNHPQLTKSYAIIDDRIFTTSITSPKDPYFDISSRASDIKLLEEPENPVINQLNEQIRAKKFSVYTESKFSAIDGLGRYVDSANTVRIGAVRNETTNTATLIVLFTGQEENKYLLAFIQQAADKSLKTGLYNLVVPDSAPKDKQGNPFIDSSALNLSLNPNPNGDVEILYSLENDVVGSMGVLSATEFTPKFDPLRRPFQPSDSLEA